jgi:hypothetical protein
MQMMIGQFLVIAEILGFWEGTEYIVNIQLLVLNLQ